MLTRPVSLVDNLLLLFAFMVEADKVIDPQELQYMQKYLQFYYPPSTADGYYKKFIEHLDDLVKNGDANEAKLRAALDEVSGAYDYTDKFFLLLTLFKIASLDGIAEAESVFLKSVAAQLSIKQDDVNYLFNMFAETNLPSGTRFLRFSSQDPGADLHFPGLGVEFIVFEVAKSYLIFNRSWGDSVRVNDRSLKPGFALRIFRDQKIGFDGYEYSIQNLQRFFIAKYNELSDFHCYVQASEDRQSLAVSFQRSDAGVLELSINKNINMLTPLGGAVSVNGEPCTKPRFINIGDDLRVGATVLDLFGLLTTVIYNRRYVSYEGKKELLIDFPGTTHDLQFRIDGGRVFIVPSGRLNQIYVNDVLVTGEKEIGAGDLIYCNKTITKVDPARRLISTGPFNFRLLRSDQIKFVFKTKQVGLDRITFEIAQNELVCVMGPSGCGKSTLLNIMNGYMKPSDGSVQIDGNDFYRQYNAYKDHIGYVPQDDLLFETLTVYENLYYNCSLRFPSKSDQEKEQLIMDVLSKVGLAAKRDTKVGNPLEKTLSGGERKRVNIALELLSDVNILFLDEPTSGLSSKDSEKIVNLLRQLADEGKIVFVVIHQPSSKLYRTFDKIILLDKGGKLAFFGPVLDALVYFKKHSENGNGDAGPVDPAAIEPEILLDSLEEPLLDLDGSPLDERKYSPDYWKQKFEEYRATLPRYEAPHVEEMNVLPPQRWTSSMEKLTQMRKLLARSFKTLFRNRSNLLISFIEAPLLGFLVAFILRYSKFDYYTLYNNELLTTWIFLTVVVILFLGMTNSVEAIIQDRLILLRERMLNISNTSYVVSKFVPLFFFSLLQNLLFLGVSFLILEMREMFIEYLIISLILSAVGIAMGLFLSSLPKISSKAAFNVVPILLIPQIIFGGALIAYEDMNKNIRFYKNDPIPEISQVMPSRWAYEAMAVMQGTDNKYDRHFDKLVEQRTVFVETREDFKAKFGEDKYQAVKDSLETQIENYDATYRDKYGNEKIALALKDARAKFRALVSNHPGHDFVYPQFSEEKKFPGLGLVSTPVYNCLIMALMFVLFTALTIMTLRYGSVVFDRFSTLMRR